MNSVFKPLLFQPESIPSCKNALVRAMLYCVSYLSGTFTTVLRENPFLRTSCSKLFNATFLKICLKIMTKVFFLKKVLGKIERPRNLQK